MCSLLFSAKGAESRGSPALRVCMCIGWHACTHGVRGRTHTDVGKESVGYTHDVVVGPTTGARDCASMVGDGTFLWVGRRGGILVGEGEYICSHGRTAARGTTKTGNEEQGDGEKEKERGGGREGYDEERGKDEERERGTYVRRASDTAG